MSIRLVGILHPSARYLQHLLHDGSTALLHSINLFTELSKTEKAVDPPATVSSPPATAVDSQVSILKIHGTEDIALPAGFQSREIKNDAISFVDALLSISKEQGALCITWLDNVFQERVMYERVIDLHQTLHAHYSYLEGYPRGVSPECLSVSGLELLSAIVRQDSALQSLSIERDTLFTLIEKRIHDFDIEVDLASKNMKQYRLSLTADTKRNFSISKKIWEAKLESIDGLDALYQSNPEYFMGPSTYLYMQLSDQNDPCIYVPYPNVDADHARYMDFKTYTACIETLHRYAPEAVLAFGLAGEIAGHPQIATCLEHARKEFSQIYVETNGRHWDLASDFWNEPWVGDIDWIVFLDSLDDKIYASIHEGQSNAATLRFIEFLSTKTRRIFIQSTRMRENEESIQSVHQFCTDKEYTHVIQKYNSYSRMLPERNVIDLAPHTRNPCCHLERDLLVTLDADVRMCTQDIEQNEVLGNVLEDDMEEIQRKKETLFVEQVHKNYKEICKNCDEYYTVNG